MADLVLLSEDDVFCVAARGRLFVQCITGQMTASHLQTIGELAALQRRSACADSLFNLTVIDATRARMSSDVRAEAIRLSAATRAHTACSAVLIDGPGVLISTMRATVATIWAMAKTSYPYNVGGHFSEILPWVAGQMARHPADLPNVLAALQHSVPRLYDRQRGRVPTALIA